MPDDEGLWTPADLARFIGYRESTVVRMASQEPRKLPPRVPHLRKARWAPEVVRAWARDSSLASVAPAAQPVRRGRPRLPA